MKNIKKSRDLLYRLLLLIFTWIVFALLNTQFRTIGNTFTILESFGFIGMATLGLSVVMISGELDLSLGSVTALAGIITIQNIEIGIFPSILITILLTALIGAIQGFIIGKYKINSVVFTIGTSIALRGLCIVIADETSVALPVSQLYISEFIKKPLSIFSIFSLTTIGLMFLVGFFLRNLKYGREIYAIGGGRKEAIDAGVPLTRTLMISFIISACCAGLAGSLVALKSGSATPYAFEGLLFTSITAIIIADFGVSGGRGTIRGLIVGLLTTITLSSGLSSMGLPKNTESLAMGLLLLIVIAFELLGMKKKVHE